MENIKNEAQRMVPTESIARQMTERMGHLENKRRNGALVVIDEQPPVGDNTTIALYMISMEAIKQKTPVAYFTPTLSNVQVVNRLISMVTGISLEKIETGTLTEAFVQRRDRLMTDEELSREGHKETEQEQEPIKTICI